MLHPRYLLVGTFTCRQSFLLAIATGVALSLLSLPASALPSSEAEQAAIVLEDYFQRFCQSASFENAKASLQAEQSFRDYNDPDSSSPADGEIWMIDDTTLSRIGLSISARIGDNRCQFAVWPEAAGVSEFVARRLEARGDWQRNFVMRPDEGNLLERRQYTKDKLQADAYYFVAEINAFRGNSTVLGLYQKMRAETTALISDPDAQWTVSTLTQDDTTIPVAETWLQGHRLQLISDTETWSLRFEPRFYPFLNRGSDEKSYFYRAQTGLNIDGRSVPSYQACTSPGATCTKDGAHFAMPLDEDSFNMLQRGQILLISAETTAGEAFDFEFSLSGLTDVLAQVESSFEPSLLAVMALNSRDKPRFLELLAADMDPNLKVNHNQHPLLWAVLSLDLPDWADRLIAHGADVNQRFEDGYGVVGTGLIMAAHFAQDVALMRQYLRLGANTEARDSQGRTALLRSVNYGGGVEKFRLLAASGADLQATDNTGRTRLHVSATAFGDRTAELEWLVDQGLNINAPDSKGNSPLHHAIRDVHMTHAYWLVRHGADPYQRNNAGQTVFDLARMIRDNPAEYHMPSAISRERADRVKSAMSRFIDDVEVFTIRVCNNSTSRAYVASAAIPPDALNDLYQVRGWALLYPEECGDVAYTDRETAWIYAFDNVGGEWNGRNDSPPGKRFCVTSSSFDDEQRPGMRCISGERPEIFFKVNVQQGRMSTTINLN